MMKKRLYLCILCVFFLGVLYVAESKASELSRKGDYFTFMALTSEIVPQVKLQQYLERGVGAEVTGTDVKSITNGTVLVPGFIFGGGYMFRDIALSAYFSHSARKLSQSALQFSNEMKIVGNSVGLSVVRYISDMKVRPFLGVTVDVLSLQYTLSGIRAFDASGALADSDVVRVSGALKNRSDVVFSPLSTEVEYKTICLAANDENYTCVQNDVPSVSYAALPKDVLSLLAFNSELKATNKTKLGFSFTGGLSFRVDNIVIEGFAAANLRSKLTFGNEKAVYVNRSALNTVVSDGVPYDDVKSVLNGKYVYLQQNGVCDMTVVQNQDCQNSGMMTGQEAIDSIVVDGKKGGDLASYVYTDATTYKDFRTYIPQEIEGTPTYTLGIRVLLLF
ncbi:hypothetical protein Fsol_00159 [Candidatus Fokinia solitaria]|uniref:Uncharacterized protein n=1 Tax=Candidatus Fokinia solitaria TaxID=1802984 RepID=A0A2U8BRI3_9RICK|nr:hypothetical protein [Candidatus Fokinia solitaria]AWD32966.1 hypothetical protein Fsol_00159 [Candidatus Fokinia solitaria]